MLLGPSSIKAANKTLVKLTPGYSKQIWSAPSILLKPRFTIFIIFHDSKLIENPLVKKTPEKFQSFRIVLNSELLEADDF